MYNNEKNADSWLINLSNSTIIPDLVSDTLRLGEKLNDIFLFNNYVEGFEIFEDMEANLHEIPNESHEEFGHKILAIALNYIKKTNKY